MTTQYENETLFEAPFAHESGLSPEMGYEAAYAGAQEFVGETEPGTHESGFEWSPEAGYETGGYETGFETGGYESGGLESGFESGGFESGNETQEEGYESGHEWSPEAGYEIGAHEGGYAATYEQEGIFGNILSGALSALGLGEEELAGEAGLEWSGEAGYESDQFLGAKIFRALRNVVGRLVPQARSLLPGALGALAGLIPGGGLLKGALGSLLPRLLGEGEGEVSATEAQMFGGNESLGEVARDERAHEAALTEIMANEAVVAESEDEATSILATTLPITITIMGGRRALRPVLPAYAQAQRRLVMSLRQDPQSRQLLRAVPSIDRRAVWLLRRWQRMGRPITGTVAVNALALQ